MSQTRPTPTTSFNFQVLFNNALRTYEKRTKNDLLSHPLAAQLQARNTPSAILEVLHQQVQDLIRSQNTHGRLTKWLDPTVNVLCAFSETLGESVSLVFSPAKVIFAGAGVLLSAVKDVRASQDNLEMMDIIGKIMVEILSILAIATKEIKQGRTKKYMKKLIGRTDVEDSLKRLDKLAHEEARMATTEVLKATHTIDDRVKSVSNQVVGVDDRVAGIDERVRVVADKISEVINGGKEARVVMQQTADDVKEANAVTLRTADNVDQIKRSQSWYNVHKWLSPPDPSTNHNIACATHQKRRANWFFQGSIFTGWGHQIPIRYFGFTANPARARASSVPPSSKILMPCTRLGMPQWRISILTFEIPTSKACTTYCHPFLSSLLLAQLLAVTFCQSFIWPTTEARVIPVTMP